MKKQPGIYMIRLRIDGRPYIGSSVDIKERWHKHKKILRKGTHHCSHLQNAWNKYGECNFEFLILEECLPEKLIEREQFYFDIIQDKFNHTPVAGSCLGYRHSEETRRKNGLAHMKPIIHGTLSGYRLELKRKIPTCTACREASRKTQEDRARRRGVDPMGSIEHRRKLGIMHLGKKLSFEHRVKIRMARRKPIVHGTHLGYHQERNRGLIPCALCQAAHNLKCREYLRSKKSPLAV